MQLFSEIYIFCDLKATRLHCAQDSENSGSGKSFRFLRIQTHTIDVYSLLFLA
jgi:hypothetical protein